MGRAQLSTNYKYPSNLYFDIFGGIEYRKYLNNRNNLELVRDVMLAINAYPGRVELKLRAFSILEYRYRDKMSLNEIGDIVGLSSTTVETIIIKTLRICRTPGNAVAKGLPGNETKEQREDRLTSERLTEKFKEIQRIVDTELQTNGQTPIEELDLSVRAYNCLKRAGIDTLSQLIRLEEKDLLKIRNLGKKCLKEVKSVLNSHYCIK